MLSRIDALEARGCLPRAQGAVAWNLMEDTLAVRPNQALFYRLHYRPEGFMDLLPGISIKVERAWFRSGLKGEAVKDIKHYIGVSTRHYEIERDTHGRLAFRPTASEQSGPVPSDRRLPASWLASMKPMPFTRLFLLGEAVARRIDRVAMIVGAPSREALAAATGSDPQTAGYRLHRRTGGTAAELRNFRRVGCDQPRGAGIRAGRPEADPGGDRTGQNG